MFAGVPGHLMCQLWFEGETTVLVPALEQYQWTLEFSADDVDYLWFVVDLRHRESHVTSVLSANG